MRLLNYSPFHQSIFCLVLCSSAAFCADPIWKQHLATGWKLRTESKLLEAEYVLKGTLHEVLPDKDAVSLAMVSDALATVYLDLGKGAECEKTYKRALKQLAERDDMDAKTLRFRLENNLAALYLESNEIREAEDLNLSRWVAYTMSDSDRTLLLSSLGGIAMERGQYETARQLFERAAALCDNMPDRKTDAAINRNNMGLVLLRLKKFPEAISYLKDASVMLEEIFRPEHPLVIRSLANLGGAYLQNKQPDDAVRFLGRSFAIAQETIGIENQTTVLILAAYVDALKKAGRGAEAKQLGKRRRELEQTVAMRDMKRNTIRASDLLPTK